MKNKGKRPEVTHTMPSLLETVITRNQNELKKWIPWLLSTCGYFPVCADGYIYAAGDIPVMLVAHMDTVHKESVKEIYISNFGNITSPQGIGGDDRCGVYSILSIILGMKKHPYVLFTEDEEIGCIGATKFVDDYKSATRGYEDIDIDFIIEIDRKGSNDAVYYECDNPDFEKFITTYGFETNWGSYSDICNIAPVLNVAAVNLSSGYYHAHTVEEVINLTDLEHTIETVIKILTDVSGGKRKKYEYIPAVHTHDYWIKSYRGKKYDWDYDWDYDFEHDNWDNCEIDYCYDREMDMAVIDDNCFILDSDNRELVFTKGEFYVDDESTVYTYDKYYGGCIESDYLVFTQDGVMLNASMCPVDSIVSMPVYVPIVEDYEYESYELPPQTSLLDENKTEKNK